MDVSYVAKLANIPLKPADEKKLESQFASTLKTVDVINELDTSKISSTSQVTGLSNVVRPDVVDLSRVLSQDQVLRPAHQTSRGFIVVPAVIDYD
jgi:aspartyl/glutamyl-tRNA(Asn/Gln) amidotransferase C subunit